jgi:nicotinate-nucleotide pyrophosphorylase (carboxylating)
MNRLAEFPSIETVRELIQLARKEDGEDVTSRLLVPQDATAVATLMQKEVGIACGLPIVEMICRAYDERLRVEQIPGFHFEIIEGRFSDARTTPLLRIRGPMRALLAAERVMLNFMQHLSGVATHTHRYVRRVEGTSARIYDTRKTLPGFRHLEKYAVRCGGGFNHRMSLSDAVLVKDNHIAAVPVKELAAFAARIVAQSRAEDPLRPVEVEVNTLEQFREMMKVEGVDIIMLDNMDCPAMQEAVAIRNLLKRAHRPALEASGGVTLETVRSVAQTGVERIAVGAITHSAPALDIGLEIDI